MFSFTIPKRFSPWFHPSAPRVDLNYQNNDFISSSLLFPKKVEANHLKTLGYNSLITTHKVKSVGRVWAEPTFQFFLDSFYFVIYALTDPSNYCQVCLPLRAASWPDCPALFWSSLLYHLCSDWPFKLLSSMLTSPRSFLARLSSSFLKVFTLSFEIPLAFSNVSFGILCAWQCLVVILIIRHTIMSYTIFIEVSFRTPTYP